MLNFIKSILKIKGHDNRPKEQDASYYNKAFQTNSGWRAHYTQSPYYFLWTVIIDRLRKRQGTRILEIASGPGQLARAIADANVAESYIGFDFSEVAVGIARQSCPEYLFRKDNALNSTIFESEDYNTVLTTEFLEHIKEDISVISKIKSRILLLGTVPNFPYISHVRHFRNCSEVENRYADLFDDFSVVEIIGDHKEKKFFLFEGIKK